MLSFAIEFDGPSKLTRHVNLVLGVEIGQRAAPICHAFAQFPDCL